MRTIYGTRDRRGRDARLLLAAPLTALTLAVTACGGSSPPAAADANAEQEPVTATAPSTETAGGEPVTVEVTLDEFTIVPSLSTFEAGVPYRFVVTNTGQIAHEFMIGAPVEAGEMDMEEMDEMALAILEEEDLGPGMTADLTVTFPTPTTAEEALEASCHLPGHYEAGMREALRVR